MDMSDPDNPKLVSRIEGMPVNLIKCGDILFGLEGFEGFSAIDLSDEANPKQITRQTRHHECGPWDMATHGEILYVEHWNLGLRFYDVSDPARPVLIYESCSKDHSHYHYRPTESGDGKLNSS